MSGDVEALQGIEMNDEEIDEFLDEQGHATLSLADGNRAYGVPVSFGYDGERIFLYLIQFGESSEKVNFSHQTERACLTTYDVESRFRWRSVIVRGSLNEIDEDEIEPIRETMDDNAWFPTIFPPTDPITTVHRMELTIEDATGRKGEEYQA